MQSFKGLSFFESTENQVSLVRWQGCMTEDFDPRLPSLITLLKKDVVFNFADLELITSIGVRLWINFIREVEVGRNIIYTHCPAEFIYQINNIPMVRGSAQVESFYGNFACDECNHDFRHFFETKNGYEKLVEEASNMRCPQCQGVAELEALTDEFFDFLAPA